jgi:hypothetical protein
LIQQHQQWYLEGKASPSDLLFFGRKLYTCKQDVHFQENQRLIIRRKLVLQGLLAQMLITTLDS